MNTNYRLWALGVLVLIVAIAFIAFTHTTKQDDVVRIGALIPLTGTGATLGEWMQKGVLEAQSEINANGGIGGKKVGLVIEDDKCDGTTAVAAYHKLHDIDGITYFIGPLCAAARVPVLAAAEKDTVLITTTGLAITYNQHTTTKTFNVLPSVTLVTDSILSFAIDTLGSKDISLLSVQDDFGSETDSAFADLLKSRGLKAVSIEKYPKGTTDMKAQLTKLAADTSDTILIAGFTGEYGVFMKQAHDLGIHKTILALSTIQAPDAAKANVGTGLKIYYPNPASSEASSSVAFLDTYKKVDSSASAMSPVYLGSGYDALELTVNAIQKCGQDVNCADAYMTSLNKYQGANGDITFGAKGNINSAGSIDIRVLKNGTFSDYK